MARKKQETMVLFPDIYTAAQKMSDTQFGALMRALFAYRFEGSNYEGDDLLVDVMFAFVKTQVDRYNETCEINRINAKAQSASEQEEKCEDREDADHCESEVQPNAAECSEIQRNTPHTHTHTHNHNHNHTQNHTHTHTQKDKSMADKPPVRPGFAPPGVEQVRQYVSDTGLVLDPQQFVDYYTANGWMVGKTKMKDWQAAARNWSRKEKPVGKAESKYPWTIGNVL